MAEGERTLTKMDSFPIWPTLENILYHQTKFEIQLITLGVFSLSSIQQS